MNFLLGFGIVALIVLSLFIILVVLMQKPSANAGMGSTLGGGAAEQAFGSDAGNILTRATVWATIIFFVLCFLLYLGTQKQVGSNDQEGISAPEGQVKDGTPTNPQNPTSDPAGPGITSSSPTSGLKAVNTGSASSTPGIKARSAGSASQTGGSN